MSCIHWLVTVRSFYSVDSFAFKKGGEPFNNFGIRHNKFGSDGTTSLAVYNYTPRANVRLPSVPSRSQRHWEEHQPIPVPVRSSSQNVDNVHNISGRGR